MVKVQIIFSIFFVDWVLFIFYSSLLRKLVPIKTQVFSFGLFNRATQIQNKKRTILCTDFWVDYYPTVVADMIYDVMSCFDMVNLWHSMLSSVRNPVYAMHIILNILKKNNNYALHVILNKAFHWLNWRWSQMCQWIIFWTNG